MIAEYDYTHFDHKWLDFGPSLTNIRARVMFSPLPEKAGIPYNEDHTACFAAVGRWARFSSLFVLIALFCMKEMSDGHQST
ncbi:MAG TPA: hypothetical protein PKW33_06410 [Anaerolineaceae bacterium]|nr:hypothetical protein [Anaerolineaceae bacterium]HPN51200.1 hypothetical protein [Anaerolineaceae bacterium]